MSEIGSGAAYPSEPVASRVTVRGDLDVFGEPVAAAFDHVYYGRLLHREQSAYQKVEVFEHEHFGRMLVLDDLIQTTERDELCYHEMLVHPPLVSRQRVERVLVIGGGDGGTLRRVMEHGPAEAVMCEIDEAVTRISRELLPSVSAGALDDPRARLVFDDGAAFVAAHENAFDAIVVDSTDPIGAAVALFSEQFYASCARALRPEGVLVTQSGSPLYQTPELVRTIASMATAFTTVEVYTGFVPTYPGVLWSFTTGTNGAGVSAVEPGRLSERAHARGLTTRFYTPQLHVASFNLPAFIADDVERSGARAPSASLS